jgi:hypothetical protein
MQPGVLVEGVLVEGVLVEGGGWRVERRAPHRHVPRPGRHWRLRCSGVSADFSSASAAACPGQTATACGAVGRRGYNGG